MSIAGVLAPLAVLWASWRPLKAAFSRRFSRAYPALAVKLRLVLGLAAVFLVSVYILMPGLLWLVVAASVAFIVLEYWRARPSWGRRRRLPPGSLRIFPPSWADDRFYLNLSREHGPIFKASNFVRPTACVVGLERGIRLLREHEERLETPYLPFSEFVPGGMLRYMRGSEHEYYRSIFRGTLAPGVIRDFTSIFSDHIQRTLKKMCEESQAGPSAARPLPYLDRMMLEMWFQLFFAIERESPEAKRLLELYPVIDITNPTRAPSRRIRASVNAIRDIVTSHFEGWRDRPPVCLLSVIREKNPAGAEDPIVIGNLIYMLTTTAADMSALLNWLLHKACEHPRWVEKISAEMASGPDTLAKPLAERFVMETLRMRQSEFIFRAVIRDIDFEGFCIPKGWLLRICVWESHRDPDVFTEPDRFDPDRFLGRTYSRAQYSPFGASTHACLAPFLVTTVARTFIEQLASGFRLSSPAGGNLILADTRHWAPGSGFRVQLEQQV